jgi:2-polyprenyl-3-methyl-5-hydroxy-6-metoxy-1,4-benzoquinol methylase
MTSEPAPGADDALAASIASFAERVALAAIGSLELATVELGMRLNLYTELARKASTAAELASAANIDQRYAREWLEQQATAGILVVEPEPLDGNAERRVFGLPVAHQICLLDPDNLASVAPLATFAACGPSVLPQLVDAYRAGSGIGFAAYGPWVRRAQADINRPQFLNLLVAEWLPAMPDVLTRLQSGPARVADIGCGSGWSCIAIALGFRDVIVDGFDTDEASIADARTNAAGAGVGERVRFWHGTGATAAARYDLVCCFESLHDMAHPIAMLAAMRRMAAPDGAVFVVDERAADALTANDPDPMQRLFYAVSVLHCLPVGRSEDGSAATGTVLRRATLERYAAEAGFTSVEVLGIDHDAFRFYRLSG